MKEFSNRVPNNEKKGPRSLTTNTLVISSSKSVAIVSISVHSFAFCFVCSLALGTCSRHTCYQASFCKTFALQSQLQSMFILTSLSEKLGIENAL